MAATYIPSRYKSSTAAEIEEALTGALSEKLDDRFRSKGQTSIVAEALSEEVCKSLTELGISTERLETAIGRAVLDSLLDHGQTAREIEKTIAKAVVDRIEKRGMSASEISKRYPSIRLEHVNKLRRGESLGFRMLSALTEAVGLRVNIEVVS